MGNCNRSIVVFLLFLEVRSIWLKCGKQGAITMTLATHLEKKVRKNIVLTANQMEALNARREETGVNIANEIRRAIEAELKRLPQITREGLLLEFGEEEIFPVMIPPSLWERVKARKVETKVPMERIVQIAVHRWLEGSEPPLAEVEVNVSAEDSEAIRRIMREELAAIRESRPGIREIAIGDFPTDKRETVSLIQFDAMPCGPLEESEFGASHVPLSGPIARILRARDGDWLVPARGESMVEAGIADGAHLLMRPYKGKSPHEGDIVLASIETEDGKRFSTIKHWYSGPRGVVTLRDGKLRAFPYPDNLKSVFPMAVFVGIIGPAVNGSGTLKGRRAESGGRPGVKRNKTDWWENPESE